METVYLHKCYLRLIPLHLVSYPAPPDEWKYQQLSFSFPGSDRHHMCYTPLLHTMGFADKQEDQGIHLDTYMFWPVVSNPLKSLLPCFSLIQRRPSVSRFWWILIWWNGSPGVCSLVRTSLYKDNALLDFTCQWTALIILQSINLFLTQSHQGRPYHTVYGALRRSTRASSRPPFPHFVLLFFVSRLDCGVPLRFLAPSSS